MARTIHELIDSTDDDFLKSAFRRVYNAITDQPKFEAELARELLSPQVLGANFNLHGSYLRTALDALVANGLIRRNNQAQYSVR